MHSDSKMSQTHKAHMVPLPLLKKQEKHRRTSLSWRSPTSDLPIFQLPTGLISAGNDVGLGLPRTFRFGILVTHQIPTETGWKNMENYQKKTSQTCIGSEFGEQNIPGILKAAPFGIGPNPSAGCYELCPG